MLVLVIVDSLLAGHEHLMDQHTYTAEIDFLTISTLGDATKFGDLNNARKSNCILDLHQELKELVLVDMVTSKYH